ncbi:MAG TPA: tetraacyldisaccharide 4'-kinase [Gammaproteobacteria bacterium]|nr:tetraacyldisaccharide 4'-kinase [Gammaproteobacteria bacterium]
MKGIDHYWYSRSPWLVLLTPLSLLFRILVRLRRSAYRTGLLRSHRIEAPVIVIGNITVGGTGKTPLVAWLAGYLGEQGFKPGIVARGYGGRATSWPQQVRADSDPAVVGDEAVLLASLTGCPMAVGPNRVAAAEALIKYNDCDLVISDDGLQHYALQRDIEIIVIDGVRRFGVGFMLPAGPLREPVSRLREADLLVVNGIGGAGEYPMKLKSGDVHNLRDDGVIKKLSDFRDSKVHAVAGIGNPERFFQFLRQVVRRVDEHAFPDHHRYRASDLRFDDDAPVLMTAKDAVKCRRFASGNEWYVPVRAEMSRDFQTRLNVLLESRGCRAEVCTAGTELSPGVQNG